MHSAQWTMSSRRIVTLLSTFHFPPSRPWAAPHPPPPGSLGTSGDGGSNKQWTVDNEQPADRHSTVYFPLSTLSAEGRPPPPLRAIRFHLVTLKKRRRAGAGEQRSRPGWHFGIGIIAFLALLAAWRFNSGAPRFDSAGLSSDFFSTSLNFFETFGAFFRRSWEAKP
jgi:hypothetical protein